MDDTKLATTATMPVTVDKDSGDIHFAPRTIGKKLPWLQKKPLQPLPSLLLDGQNSGMDTPSPGTNPPSRRLSVAPLPRRATTTSPTYRRSSQAVPKPDRFVSTVKSSPSPIPRYPLSSVQRVSQAPETVSVPRIEHRSPPAREAPKRVTIAEDDGDLEDQDPFKDNRARAASPVKVSGKLETPDATGTTLEHSAMSTPPAAFSRVLVSPRQPAPGHHTYDKAGSRKLSRAVEDLEVMVHEAVDMADEAVDDDQVQEIFEIIDEARIAIKEASSDPATQFAISVPPSEASDSSSGSRESSVHDYHELEQRAPPRRLPPRLPRAHIGDFSQGVRNRHGKTGSVDWAYRNHEPKEKETDPSSGGTSDTHDSRTSTRSDLLLRPDPVQATARDHIDFVLRPMTTGKSRGRPHRRVRHRRRRSNGNIARPRSQARSRSRRRRDTTSDDTENETPFEEDPPTRPYGNELYVREQVRNHTFNFKRHPTRQPIARNWTTGRKRFTACVACINTALLGIMIGIYAGEVPRIQYFLADERHIVVVSNVVLYFGLALSTFFTWTLPLLHGRKPYTLAALAIALPLQFPQAVVVGYMRSPSTAKFRAGLLCARAFSGLILGFANVNYFTVLLDLFGASLQSRNPHQEFVVTTDVRRHGGGMGIWLGIWSWCWVGSLAVGFQVGAAVIEKLSPDWGFYIVVIILAFALVLNIMAPETRRAQYRKSVTEVYDRDENYITRRVSRGEAKLHISMEGPKYWFEEVWAGMKLMVMMIRQPGFLVLALYLGWIYAQIVLVIVLLGALLSRDYQWKPRYVGAGVMSIAIGGFLAIPLTKAGIFSRDRKKAFRTDSMTFQKQITWSSHLVRRVIFTLTLPLMGLAYTVSSAGRPKPHMVPIVFAGAVGFLSVLAIAECHGLIMETFDTCDLQPGSNTKHRLESMAVQDRRRRTNYTSFPRVSAGIFASQTLAFIGAAVATVVGGSMTRHLGAQASTGVTAGILLGLTLLLTAVLWRFKEVQVIPNHTFRTRRDTVAWQEFRELEKLGRGSDWKPVVIGNPSGKMRRMNVLEMGSLSRWTEIRKMNFLLKGPRLGERKQKRRSIRESW